MPVCVHHVRVGPRVGLPDPRSGTGRRVGTLTTCPVSLISRQTEHARSLANTSQTLCTDAKNGIDFCKRVCNLTVLTINQEKTRT